jgi:hypothetical protein
MPLQPLSPTILAIAAIRRQMREMERQLDELEAACGGGYEPRKVVEFAFKPEKKRRKR